MSYTNGDDPALDREVAEELEKIRLRKLHNPVPTDVTDAPATYSAQPLPPNMDEGDERRYDDLEIAMERALMIRGEDGPYYEEDDDPTAGD